MPKTVIYAIAALVVLEVLREILRFRKKRRLEKSGELSRWALERYIDFKKLAFLLAIVAVVYFSFPFIKETFLPGIRSLDWLLNRQLLYLFLKVIGAMVVMEVVYKLVLMKFIGKLASVWDRLLRYCYWGVLIYLAVGLWPYGRDAYYRMRAAIDSPYQPKTEEERRQIERIRALKDKMDEFKGEQQGQYEPLE